MKYESMQMEPFPVIGISVRTTNRNGQSATDIGALWKRFYAEEIRAKIPGKRTDDLYCVYTEYEQGQEGWYKTLLGCRVDSLENIPEKLSGLVVPASRYLLFRSDGSLPETVQQTWIHIWQSNIKRKFAADFDVYPAFAEGGITTVRTYLSVP